MAAAAWPARGPARLRGCHATKALRILSVVLLGLAFLWPQRQHQPPAAFTACARSRAAARAVLGSAAKAADAVEIGSSLAVDWVDNNAFKGPRFLKTLLDGTDFVALGGILGVSKLSTRTNTDIRLSDKGQYYPYSTSPKKVIIISGEAADILEAFADLQANCTEGLVTFLVPTSATGQLIGHDGQNIKQLREAVSAEVFIRNSPGLESQVVVRGPREPQEAYARVAAWVLDEQAQHDEEMRRHLYLNYQSSGRARPSEISFNATEQEAARIIGKAGRVISRLRARYNVGIGVDNHEGNAVIRVSGALGDVHAAHQNMLERFMREPGP